MITRMLISNWNKFLNRCIERNVVLKLSKSWFGFAKVQFYGYVVENLTYHLSDERKLALQQIPFPLNQKQAMSVMGSGVVFKPFVPNYSTISAPLHDMTTKNFNWNKKTWTVDYKKIFEDWKQVLSEALTLFYPDYDLLWLVRPDASTVGVGGVIFQQHTNLQNNNEITLQPIFIACQKLSHQAKNWVTIEHEGYGIFFIVKKAEYHLRLKSFILETDHNNLRYMEKSSVPRIIRWVTFLQSFTFVIRHIPGKLQVFPDMLSRMISWNTPEDDV